MCLTFLLCSQSHSHPRLLRREEELACVNITQCREVLKPLPVLRRSSSPKLRLIIPSSHHTIILLSRLLKVYCTISTPVKYGGDGTVPSLRQNLQLVSWKGRCCLFHVSVVTHVCTLCWCKSIHTACKTAFLHCGRRSMKGMLLVSRITRVCIVSVYLQTVKHYSHCLQLNCWSMEEPLLLVSHLTRVCIVSVPAAVKQASNVEKLPGKGSAGFTLNSCVHSLVYLCQWNTVHTAYN